MNYSGPINTVFPVNCLIYTAQPLARSYPFSGYSNLDYTPKTIKCVKCASINPDYHLHGFECLAFIFPGLLRGRLSSLAEVERKKGVRWSGEQMWGRHPGQQTASNLATRLSFSFQGCPRDDASAALPGTSVLSVTGEHQSPRLFPILRLLFSETGAGNGNPWTQPPAAGPQITPSSEFLSFWDTSDRSHQMHF